MSTRRGNISHGPPKHQNKVTFIPGRSLKKKAKEVGGSLGYTYGDISGVCLRCKDIIEWKRKYGKYKPLIEAQKCSGCGKRAVRQAYHALCSACAHQRGVCAKCMQAKETTGRSAEQEEMERNELEKAMSTLRERDRRTLLRTLNKGAKVGDGQEVSTKGKVNDSMDEGVEEEGDDADGFSDEGEDLGENEEESGEEEEEEAGKEESGHHHTVAANDMSLKRMDVEEG